MSFWKFSKKRPLGSRHWLPRTTRLRMQNEWKDVFHIPLLVGPMGPHAEIIQSSQHLGLKSPLTFSLWTYRKEGLILDFGDLYHCCPPASILFSTWPQQHVGQAGH
jgi:hypothetical protein